MAFPELKIPEFVNVKISEKLTVSTEILYSSAKTIFLRVLKNFLKDENLKRKFRNKSIYTNFMRSYSKQQRSFPALKYAKYE